MGFTKLDEGIVFSSIMGEDDSVFRVWIVLLATCKENGVSPTSEVFLSTITKKPLEEIQRCVTVLSSPDLNSRSQENEGRRIERINGGFYIINYQKYKELSYKEAEARRKYLEYHSPEKSGNLRTSTGGPASASSSGINSGINQAIDSPTWRTKFNIYKAECEAAFDAASQNREWLKERKTYHPNLDIGMTLQKAFFDFWGTEAGWKHKKSKKAKDIDWQRTINNAVDLRGNWVYEKKPIR